MLREFEKRGPEHKRYGESTRFFVENSIKSSKGQWDTLLDPAFMARKTADETERTYLHRGIATRAFERRFALADHVRVAGAVHEHGMLHIDLVREVPEAMKPRRIEISRTASATPVIEAKPEAVN